MVLAPIIPTVCAADVDDAGAGVGAGVGAGPQAVNALASPHTGGWLMHASVVENGSVHLQQSVGSINSVLNVPTEHCWQAMSSLIACVIPGLCLLPAMHSLHAVLPDASEYFPSGHHLQLDRPATDSNLPSSHCWH